MSSVLANISFFDFSWVSQPEAWVALLTLSCLEIVLGIDNIVFISILVSKLPPSRQGQARILGLALAMLTRIGLLFSIAWVMQLKETLFTIWSHEISGKDAVLIVGGVFLLFKSTHEIHSSVEEDSDEAGEGKGKAVHSSFTWILIQIALLDIVFSLDSVITAVGMAQSLSVMGLAVILAVGFMMIFSGSVSNFIMRYPTIKMLALSFLILIGTALVAEGLHLHIPHAYIYFAMGFSMAVEMLNIRASKKRKNRSRVAE